MISSLLIDIAPLKSYTLSRFEGRFFQMYEDVKELALKLGFDACGETTGRLVPCDKTFRRFCEANTCGMYGNCHMCPPAAGPAETLIAKMHNYKTVIAFTKEYPCPDPANYLEAQIAHERLSQLLWMSMQKLGYPKDKARVFSVGGCHLCEECAIKTGEPCRHPDIACPSVSAYCVVTDQLAKDVGLDMNAKNGGLVFIALAVFK